MILWNAFQQWVLSNWQLISGGLVFVAVAAFTSMPKPGTPFSLATLYTWLYETVQSVLPANRAPRPSSIAQPSPAALTVPHEVPEVEVAKEKL